jgi:hypothetical protein
MRITCLVVAVVALSACSRRDAKQEAPRQQPVVERALDAGVTIVRTAAADAGRPDAGPGPEFTGRVRGVVKLAKGAKLPIAPPVLTHGVKPPSIKPCPPVDQSDQRVVTQSSQTGGLSPIHVALTGMRGKPAREPTEREVFIDACRLRPTLIGALLGDTIKVTNRSETALVPSLPGAPFMRGMLRGETQTFEAKKVQMHINCSFGSYCGDTLVVTSLHPFFDVTTEEGFFEIEQVPLDQELKVHAWHPLFKENNVSFKLTRDEPEKMIELVLTPAPPKPLSEAPREPEFTRPPSKSRVIVQPSPKKP